MTAPIISPQAYPLWCALLGDDREIRVGRVIAWHVTGAVPIVALEADDGSFAEAGAVATGRLCLGDSRQDVLGAVARLRRLTCPEHDEPMVRVDEHQWRCPRDDCVYRAAD